MLSQPFYLIATQFPKKKIVTLAYDTIFKKYIYS